MAARRRWVLGRMGSPKRPHHRRIRVNYVSVKGFEIPIIPCANLDGSSEIFEGSNSEESETD